jgi:uncharacterized membrane protein (UPF0127 family)
MPWCSFLFEFVSGLFLANGVPHTIASSASFAAVVSLKSRYARPAAESSWQRRAVARLLVAACVALAANVPAQAAGEATLKIISKTGVHLFSVELATNDAARSRGLMFRRELPEGRGMLFDFEHDQPVAFWMHNTYISLDMIFIGSDGRIRRIAENTKPLSDRSIPSGVPVRAVLEVIAGTARKLGIVPGNRVAGAMFGRGP